MQFKIKNTTGILTIHNPLPTNHISIEIINTSSSLGTQTIVISTIEAARLIEHLARFIAIATREEK